MNSVIVNGNIGREPEITMTSGGKKLCNFSLANDKGNKEVQWVDCRAWDIKAEYLEKYVHKGYRLLVQGRLMFDSYTKDGEKRKSIYILCDRIEIERSTENDTRRSNTQPKDDGSQNAPDWLTIVHQDKDLEEDLPF